MEFITSDFGSMFSSPNYIWIPIFGLKRQYLDLKNSKTAIWSSLTFQKGFRTPPVLGILKF
jgi:hypothetical protein